ncbi:MAG: DUF2007 domain-containing protein [Blastocatellia bacterium]
MWIDEESGELKERISKLSDEELLNMVEVEPDEYRREALDYAKAELMVRGIRFQETQEPSDEEADSTISESNVMKKLITCKNVAEAGLLKGLLAGRGIACEIRGEYLSMASGELPFTECHPELWVVGDEEFKSAKEFLDEWQSKEGEQQASWICERCREENEGQFNSCWSCGWVKTE